MPDFAKSIGKYAKLIGPDFNQGKVIYAGERTSYTNIDYLPFAET